MKIKVYLVLILLLIDSCSFRKKIEIINLAYEDSLLQINLNITHKEKINNSYSYYGDFNLQIFDPARTGELQYFIVRYKNEKSKIYYNTAVDYGDFWSHPSIDKNGNMKEKIYIVFKERNLDPKNLSIVKIDKKFRYLPLDFYDHKK